MANISDIKNLVACGAGASLGTGTKGCKPFFQKVVSLWLLPTDTTLDDAQELNLTYVQQLQAEGKLIVLNGVETVADNTPDDVVEELEGGSKAFIRGAKYEFKVDFINGLFFHSALHSLNSFAAYDVIMVDRAGNILGTQDSAGLLKGFQAGMIQASKLKWADDSTQQRESLMFQLVKRSEVDSNYVFIDKANLPEGFDATSVTGVNEVNLSVSTPSNAATSLTVTAKRKQDGGAVSGLAFGDFNVTVDGATANPTADDAEATGAGIYVLTVAALATNEVVVTRLYDNSNNRAAINKTGVLYKSNSPSVTVV